MNDIQIVPAPDFLTPTELITHVDWQNISLGPIARFAMWRNGIKPKKIRKRMREKYGATGSYTVTFICDSSHYMEVKSMMDSGAPFRSALPGYSVPVVIDLVVTGIVFTTTTMTITTRSVNL